MEDFPEFMETASDALVPDSIADMALRLLLNLGVVLGLARWLYYPKSHRKDYLFVFIIISMAIFLMVNLLGNLKIKVGFALGLFAIFGIIRYRTEQMPVREMTYLFVIIAMSVINGLSMNLSWGQTLTVNALLVAVTLISEMKLGLRNVRTKIVAYDDVSMTKPDRRAELLADLSQRTGLQVTDVEVGHIDFIKDMAMLKVHYVANANSPRDNDMESMNKIPNN